MSESFEATEETVLVSYRSGTLTSAIFSYANYENEELRRICIHLHNAKQIDLLELVHSDEFNSVSNTSFFAGQKFFDDVLPELTASVPAMMRCVKSLVDRGGRDLAANFPLESFRAWCGRDLERAREVISIAQSNEEAANGFLTAALIVGNYEEDARYFALGYHDSRQLAGVFALGKIARTSVSDADTALMLLEQLVMNSDAELLYANVLLAGLELAKNSPGSDADTLSRIVSHICRHPSPMVLNACSQAILLYPTQLTNQLLTSLLQTLRSLPTTQKGSLSTLDAALSQLLNGSTADKAIDFVTDYLLSNRETLSLSEFGSFESSLQRNSVQLQKALLSWMLIGDIGLCEGVARLFRNGEDKPYHFDVSVCHLSPSDQVFICRKVLGHMFTQPSAASSFLVCVLRQCDEQVADTLSQLLLDVILRNYSGSARKYLSSNLEAPYRVSELVILHVWEMCRPLVGNSNDHAKAMTSALHQVIGLHLSISLEFLEKKILPHVGKLDAIATSVHARSNVDINQKLFDLVGRIAMAGIWLHWLSDFVDTGVATATKEQVSRLNASAFNLIANNGALLLPLCDINSIEIALLLMFSGTQQRYLGDARQWLAEMASRLDFTLRTHGRYTCVFTEYRLLINHPKEQTEEYRKEATSGSTLIPILVAWSAALSANDAVATLAELKKTILAHCTLQLWLPDSDSESSLYLGDHDHGVAITDIPIDLPSDRYLAAISNACARKPAFESLSAIRSGFWPIVLLACRHHRFPVPPQFWTHMLRADTEATSTADTPSPDLDESS